jgi:glutathione S-transferase
MIKKGITLVYDPICPFAQRVWLTLLEKQVPFDKMRIDLKNKTQELKDLYKKAFGADPTSDGKVPLLVHDEKVLSESDLLSWYLA